MQAQFLPKANNQITEIWLDLEAKRIGLGDDFLDELEVTIDHVQQFPEGYIAISPNIRRLPMKRFKYSIFYHFDKEAQRIDVVQILPQSASPRRWPE